MNLQDKGLKTHLRENFANEEVSNNNLTFHNQRLENPEQPTLNEDPDQEQPRLGFWKSLLEIIQLIKFIDDEEPGR
ncbi:MULTISPECIES: hypothetical protein [unclassified Tolypothrix]|uniref:hypothetical protein n=1 Tax=unclassified Tolypothrix TaxID=2649714 RepID=UPI0005EAAA53|nr:MULTISPECIES: hypothetical protein [unclassified Tolypothrix]BAY89679.1 hypothetical protein NIES3275_16820 [Microchaete diplosiphon NIES-3275]EKE97618.1 hypothetical protein FDUTEX481_04996 [Tolypothrix sp. PCC 7601]MBE9085261.1 hypothetical protein [Tolypothrix sp. LEGE 11397]UYD23948.1 hypothetical protein HGR01_20830 [Tolypothrix sp. PCC 7712]UYD33825.1 hypothetical protein HG267_33915 [Tolypothrix sp. PCC 7601]